MNTFINKKSLFGAVATAAVSLSLIGCGSESPKCLDCFEVRVDPGSRSLEIVTGLIGLNIQAPEIAALDPVSESLEGLGEIYITENDASYLGSRSNGSSASGSGADNGGSNGNGGSNNNGTGGNDDEDYDPNDDVAAEDHVNNSAGLATVSTDGFTNALGGVVIAGMLGDIPAATKATGTAIALLGGQDFVGSIIGASEAFQQLGPDGAENPLEGMGEAFADLIGGAINDDGEIDPSLFADLAGDAIALLDETRNAAEIADLVIISNATTDAINAYEAPDLNGAALLEALAVLDDALALGDLELAGNAAAVVAALTATPELIGNPADLATAVQDQAGLDLALIADLSAPEARLELVDQISKTVTNVNQFILGLIPETDEPVFDPLVGAIITATNALETIAGTDPSGTILDALANDLDGSLVAETAARALANAYNDTFTLVLPIRDDAPELAAALDDAMNNVDNVMTLGLSGLFDPVGAALQPIYDCLESESPEEARDALQGNGSSQCVQ